MRNNQNINAFILAAGFGERLRPITDYIPKPLMPVLGKPLIELVLEQVVTLSPANTGINLHYKAEKICDYLKTSPFWDRITLFQEETILGTGGALKNAENFLRSGLFLVYNSDISSDIDIEKLVEHHLSSNNLATLAVHDYPEYNNLETDKNGFLKRAATKENPAASGIAFTGIAIYSPDFLSFLPYGFSSVVTGWMNAISAGRNIKCLPFNGHNWSDIGSPAAYASTVIRQLNSCGETVYIHPSTDCNADIQFSGYLVVEQGSVIEKGSSLKNCILIPYSRINAGSKYKNSIIGNEFTIPLDEFVFTGQQDKESAVCIGQGGSDRRYFRIKRDGESVVLMQTSGNDPDFVRQIELTRFFYTLNISVPRLIEADYHNFRAVFEYLGSVSLYSLLKIPRTEDKIESIYRKVLDSLLLIHIDATRHVRECRCLEERIFDYEHFRWESSYFMEMFVEGIKRIDMKDTSLVYDEFHTIASKADKFKKTVIHRDFQSQNIMIAENEMPRIIDYQGARMAPPAYDIASILWDPYYRLSDSLRDRLLDYYMSKLLNQDYFTKAEFMEALMLCRLQRHMQALGAYGFLSSVKGKSFFLKHIPEGLRLLKEDAALLKDDYPELYNLTLRL